MMTSSSRPHSIADGGAGPKQEPCFSSPQSCWKRSILPFKWRPAPPAPEETPVLSARLLNHPDGAPQIDKAAGDLQTPFNKALFSGGLIPPPPPPSPSLPRLTPGLSLSLSFSPTLQPSVSRPPCLTPLPPLPSLPFALPSLFVPGIKRGSLTGPLLRHLGEDAGWHPALPPCSSFSSRFWGRI